MTIDKPKVPTIPEPSLGVSREILGDPCVGDGGGGGQKIVARKEDQRGPRRSKEKRQMWDRGNKGRTGQARNAAAAEEPVIWVKNRTDGTWRRSGGVLQPGPAVSAERVP